MRINSIDGGHAIASKLKARDVVTQYQIDDAPSAAMTSTALGSIESALRDGKSVRLTVLRPNQGVAATESYNELKLTITAADLRFAQRYAQPAYTVMTPRTEQTPRAASYTVGGDGIIRVSVGYATDRALVDSRYTGARNTSDEPVRYGMCEVTLPPDHRRGQIESPKWWKFEFKANPKKHVTIASVREMGRAQLFEKLRKQQENQDTKRLLLFVHGYNVSFADAAMRSAQLQYDLEFPGVSMFYSWPSDADLQSYVSDSQDIAWSVANITRVLRALVRNANLDEIYIVAHSMGNRGVTQALLALNENPNGKLKSIILAAPDVDAVIFDRDIAPQLERLLVKTTVYASSGDKALVASSQLNEVPRAGEIRSGQPTISSLPQMEIIDASRVKTDFLGHSYYGDGDSIVADMHALIVKQESAMQRRSLLKQSGAKGTFWVYSQPNE